MFGSYLFVLPFTLLLGFLCFMKLVRVSSSLLLLLLLLLLLRDRWMKWCFTTSFTICNYSWVEFFNAQSPGYEQRKNVLPYSCEKGVYEASRQACCESESEIHSFFRMWIIWGQSLLSNPFHSTTICSQHLVYMSISWVSWWFPNKCFYQPESKKFGVHLILKTISPRTKEWS